MTHLISRPFILAGTFIFLLNSAISQPLTISHLTGDFYIFTTSQLYKGILVPANGMYLITDRGAVLFDMPWDTTQVLPLLDSIRSRHQCEAVLSVSTHFHGDRTGGIDILKRKAIRTYSSYQTYLLCAEKQEKQAAFYFVNDTTFQVGNYEFSTFYPGKGHSEDNIVIWLEKEKILYGGCFVKSTETTDLGNLHDADLPAWKKSMERTIAKFRKPRFVIPGHEGWSSKKSLKHTLHLVEQALKSPSQTG